ncbi:MAG TPA: hypothetical protein VD735_04455 [Candidatus Saccharimonadales bacterium]|nr:hypothetical protein [Candidatus Saccharimonadales bacterium]
MSNRKSLLIGGGIAVAVVAAGIGGWALTRAESPEKMLYSAMAIEPNDASYSKETGEGDNTTKLSSISYSKGAGSQRSDMQLSCNVSDPASGNLAMDIRLNQIDEKLFMNYEKLAMSGTGDTATETAVNDYFKQLSGQWVAFTEPDPALQGYKDKGVFFSLLGADSKKLSAQQISDKMQEHNVMTINSSKDVTVDGKKAIQYNLDVRRSAYEKFMDDIAPSFSQKTDVMNSLFDNDTEEVELTIDRETKDVLGYSYDIANPCLEMVAAFAPEAVGDFPEVVRITGTVEDKNDADKLTAPANAMSEQDFATLLSGEEEL